MTANLVQILLILLYLGCVVAYVAWSANLEFWGGPTPMLGMGLRYSAMCSALSFFLTIWIHSVGAASLNTTLGYAIAAAFVTFMVCILATIITIGKARIKAMYAVRQAETMEKVTLEVFDQIDTHGIGMITRKKLIATIVNARPGRNRTRKYLQKLLDRFDLVAGVIDRKLDRNTGELLAVKTISRINLSDYSARVRKSHSCWQPF